MHVKVSFEMDGEDWENLTFILHNYIVKHKFESQTDETFSQAEKDWHVRHANYVQKDILDKLIASATKV